MSATSTTLPLDQPTSSDAMCGGAMSVDVFCRQYSIGKTKAYSEAKAGRLQLRKIGSKTIIARVDAERWLASLPSTSAS